MSFPPPAHTINPSVVFQLIPLVLLLLVLGVWGQYTNPPLMYAREAIQGGQFWRVITGHLVHLGLTHTLLNIAGLLLITHTFRTVCNPKLWWLSGMVMALGISLLFLVFNPWLEYYAGLSGVLHGLLMMVFILSLRDSKIFDRRFVILAIAILVMKLVYEQQPQYSAGYIEDAMNAPVIVDAHLYGAIMGLVIGVLNILYHRWCFYRAKH